jgi:hypothetical protein
LSAERAPGAGAHHAVSLESLRPLKAHHRGARAVTEAPVDAADVEAVTAELTLQLLHVCAEVTAAQLGS